mmetsp:Transcript_18598/g.44578  ORF Transcript_18598/g.44578 Transcript_18598/m.44578 type:complete len:207 (-) Transcript_18598:87-707(-)
MSSWPCIVCCWSCRLCAAHKGHRRQRLRPTVRTRGCDSLHDALHGPVRTGDNGCGRVQGCPTRRRHAPKYLHVTDTNAIELKTPCTRRVCHERVHGSLPERWVGHPKGHAGVETSGAEKKLDLSVSDPVIAIETKNESETALKRKLSRKLSPGLSDRNASPNTPAYESGSGLSNFSAMPNMTSETAVPSNQSVSLARVPRTRRLAC